MFGIEVCHDGRVRLCESAPHVYLGAAVELSIRFPSTCNITRSDPFVRGRLNAAKHGTQNSVLVGATLKIMPQSQRRVVSMKYPTSHDSTTFDDR